MHVDRWVGCGGKTNRQMHLPFRGKALWQKARREEKATSVVVVVAANTQQTHTEVQSKTYIKLNKEACMCVW